MCLLCELVDALKKYLIYGALKFFVNPVASLMISPSHCDAVLLLK